ncbi:MAG: response regulator [Nitrospirae bacterium]|nr:response regulator [Nitrospirota bacterium]
MAEAKILVVDDEPDVLEVVKSRLKLYGFQVITAGDGEEALRQVEREGPDLMLLDVNLPKKDGLEVLRILREDILHRHLPIIMLTAKGDIADKLAGIEAGADDYITKPFDSTELIARTRMILMRTSRGLDANPLTRLPGNISIARELESRLRNKKEFSFLYIDQDNFKCFNDHYGYQRGDKAIKTTASIIIKVVKNEGSDGDFVGHIGGDDFVVITGKGKEDAICRGIIDSFTREIILLYDEEDRKRGYLGCESRECSRKDKAGIMTLSIGVVAGLPGSMAHSAEISLRGAELKEKAKALPGSRYVKA